MALAPIGLEAIIRGVGSFNAGITQMNRKIHLFGSTAKSTGRQAGGISKSIDRLGNSITNVGRSALRAGISMSFLVTAPVVAGFAAATNAAINFETELTKISTLAGIPTDLILNTRDAILGLGDSANGLGLAIETGTDAVELASAAYFIYSSGVRDAATANSILEQSAKASAIGLGETEVIAQALTSVIGAYSLSADQAAGVTDTLLVAIQRGKAEADQFAGSLSKVLPLAASLGIEFDEVASFIATYTIGGATAAEATNGLRRALIALLNPTQSAKDALAAIHTSAELVVQQIGEQGLEPTLFALRRDLDALGIPLINVFGRIEGLNAVLFNTGPAADLYVENTQAIANANGALERSFETVQLTTGFQLAQLKASFQVLGITIGSIFLPAINQLVQKLLPLVVALSKFAETHPQLVLVATALALVTAAIGPLLVGIGFAITAFGTIVGAIGTVVGAISAVIGPIGLLVGAIVAVGLAIGLGLVAGVQYLKKTSVKVQNFFDGLAGKAFKWGQNIVLQLAKGIIRAAIYVVQALASIGRAIAHFLAPGSPPALLPDLPEWGEAAMNEWLHGFTNADFDVFNDIAGTLEKFFRSLALEDDTGLIPSILQIRSALAGAIAEFNGLGDATSGAIAEIVANLNLGNADLEAYVQTMLELQAATQDVLDIQEEIANVNSQFDSILGPLNDELQAIRDRRDAFRQQEEIANINEALQDPDLTGQERQLLLDRLREIQLQNQIDSVEELRDAELDALQEQLDAAQAEVQRLQDQADAQQALIEAQTENNNLIREQIDLLKSLVEKLDEAAGSVADIAGEPLDVSDFVGGAVDPCALICGDDPDCDCEDPFDLGGLQSKAEEALGNLENSINEFFAPIKEDIIDLRDAWKNLGQSWAPVVEQIIAGTFFGNLKEKVKEELQPTIDYLNELPAVIFLEDWADRFGTRLSDIMGAGAGLATALAEGDFETAGEQMAELIIGGLQATFLVGELTVKALAALFIGIYNWFAAQDWASLWKSFKTAAGQFLGGLWGRAKRYFEFFLRQLIAWFQLQDWKQIGFDAMTFLLNGLKHIWEFVTDTLPGWLKDIVQWGVDVLQPGMDTEGKEAAKSWVGGLVQSFFDLQETVTNAILDIGRGILQAWNQWWQDHPLGVPSPWADPNPPTPPPAQHQPGDPVVPPTNPGTPGQGPGTGGPPGRGASGFGSFLASGAAAIASRQVAAPQVVTNNIQLNFNPVIQTGRDEAWLRQLIRQEVAMAVGRR